MDVHVLLKWVSIWGMRGLKILLWRAPWARAVMMMLSNGNIFHITGPLWGESTRHQWIPSRKASDAELWCFLWSVPHQSRRQWLEMPWASLWHHCNGNEDHWDQHWVEQCSKVWHYSNTGLSGPQYEQIPILFWLCGHFAWLINFG